MFLFVTTVKLLAEIALMALLGQGFLALLAGDKRESNFFYQLLKILTRPFTAAARFITPRQVGDHQVGFVNRQHPQRGCRCPRDDHLIIEEPGGK